MLDIKIAKRINTTQNDISGGDKSNTSLNFLILV